MQGHVYLLFAFIDLRNRKFDLLHFAIKVLYINKFGDGGGLEVVIYLFKTDQLVVKIVLELAQLALKIVLLGVLVGSLELLDRLLAVLNRLLVVSRLLLLLLEIDILLYLIINISSSLNILLIILPSGLNILLVILLRLLRGRHLPVLYDRDELFLFLRFLSVLVLWLILWLILVLIIVIFNIINVLNVFFELFV